MSFGILFVCVCECVCVFVFLLWDSGAVAPWPLGSGALRNGSL